MFIDAKGRTNRSRPFLTLCVRHYLHGPVVRAGQLFLRVCEPLWGVGGLASVSVPVCISEVLFVSALLVNCEVYLSCSRPTSLTHPPFHSIIHRPNPGCPMALGSPSPFPSQGSPRGMVGKASTELQQSTLCWYCPRGFPCKPGSNVKVGGFVDGIYSRGN